MNTVLIFVLGVDGGAVYMVPSLPQYLSAIYISVIPLALSYSKLLLQFILLYRIMRSANS